MDLNHTPSRVLWLFALYQAAVAAVYVAGPGGRSVALGGLALVHVAIAALLLRFASRAPSRETSRWRLALPYALWLACWLQLGWLIRFSGHPMHDAQIAAADLALFGGHGHLLFARWLPQADQVMHLIYLSYYGLVLGPPLVLALRRRTADCQRYTRVVMATYLLCFLIYLLYPVLGPRAAAAAQAAAGHDGGALGGGALGALTEALRQAGDSPGTAFPSSHCAGAFAAALAAGAMVSRRTRALLLVWAGLITLSTIHTGNHYGIDAAAGVLLAVSVHLAAIRVRQDRVRQAQLRHARVRQFRVRQARVVVPKEVLS